MAVVFTRAMQSSAGISHCRVCVCVCVCLSVERPYCVKSAKRTFTETMPHDSTRTSFLTPTVVDGRRPIPPEIFAQFEPPPPF